MSQKPFTVLGVSYDATDEAIQGAFRRLVKVHHPDVDKSPQAPEKFRQIYAAYDLLRDSRSRQEQRVRWEPPKASSSKSSNSTEQATTTSGTGTQQQAGPRNTTGAYFGGSPGYATNANKAQSAKASAQTTTNSSKAGTRSRRSRSEQVSSEVDSEPSLDAFGLPSDYHQRMLEGVRLWQNIEPVPSKNFQYFTGFALIGALLLIPPLRVYILPAAMVSLIALFFAYEKYHEIRKEQFLKTYLALEFNPNRQLWEEYVRAMNRYHERNLQVFRTKTGRCYHQSQYCVNGVYTDQTTLKAAEEFGLTACSKCTGYIKPHLQTPYPFSRDDIYG